MKLEVSVAGGWIIKIIRRLFNCLVSSSEEIINNFCRVFMRRKWVKKIIKI